MKSFRLIGFLACAISMMQAKYLLVQLEGKDAGRVELEEKDAGNEGGARGIPSCMRGPPRKGGKDYMPHCNGI